MRSMRSKGWGFRKVRGAFPYFLFLVSYSLFPCVFLSLLHRGKKNVQEVQYIQCVQKVGHFEKLEVHFHISYF